MNQAMYENSGSGLSQAEKILLALRVQQACCGGLIKDTDWVSLPYLVDVSGGYAVHSRVADLRKLGHDIEQMSVRRSGKVHSFYRLKGNA
jgi:hypothetical protein